MKKENEIKIFEDKKVRNQLSSKIGQLKLKSSDGKSNITDVADTEQLFRRCCSSQIIKRPYL